MSILLGFLFCLALFLLVLGVLYLGEYLERQSRDNHKGTAVPPTTKKKVKK